MKISRRTFLIGTASALSTAAVSSSLLLSQGCSFRSKVARIVLCSQQGILFFANIDGTNPWEIKTDLISGHGFVNLPNETMAVFEKKGKKLLHFDVKNRQCLSYKDASPGAIIYGHGSYSRKTNLLYNTEAPASQYRKPGSIVIRNPTNLNIISEYSSHGYGPHDIVVMESEGLLAIQNASGLKSSRANIVFLDISNGKLVCEAVSPLSNLNFSHIAYGGENRIIASARIYKFKNQTLGNQIIKKIKMESRPEILALLSEELSKARMSFPTVAYDVTTNGKFQYFQTDIDVDRLKDAFNVRLSLDNKYVATSHQSTSSIAIYNAITRKLVSIVDFPNEYPESITPLDNGDFLVGCSSKNFFRVECPFFRKFKLQFVGISSEHANILA